MKTTFSSGSSRVQCQTSHLTTFSVGSMSPSPPPPPSPPSTSSSLDIGLIVGLTVGLGGSALIAATIFAVFQYRKRKRRSHGSSIDEINAALLENAHSYMHDSSIEVKSSGRVPLFFSVNFSGRLLIPFSL